MRAILLLAFLTIPITAEAGNSVNLSYSQTSGNSDTSTLSFSYSTELKQEKSLILSQGSYLYKEDNGKESANRLEINNSYERSVNRRISLVINNFIFSDRFSGYNLRLGLGPGVKVKLQENLSLTSTITYVYNNYRENSNENYYQGEVKLNYAKNFSKNLTFRQLLSYQVSFKNSDDYFLHSKSEVSVPINEKLSLTVSYQVDYQNLLPQGVNYHTDKLFLTGVSYNF